MNDNELKIRLWDAFEYSSLLRIKKLFSENMVNTSGIDKDIDRLKRKGAFEIDVTKTLAEMMEEVKQKLEKSG